MIQILEGDAVTVLRGLPDEKFNCCVTSPPYWGLRDYGVEGQLGLEKTPELYVARMVEVFRRGSCLHQRSPIRTEIQFRVCKTAGRPLAISRLSVSRCAINTLRVRIWENSSCELSAP